MSSKYERYHFSLDFSLILESFTRQASMVRAKSSPSSVSFMVFILPFFSKSTKPKSLNWSSNFTVWEYVQSTSFDKIVAFLGPDSKLVTNLTGLIRRKRRDAILSLGKFSHALNKISLKDVIIVDDIAITKHILEIVLKKD